MRRSHNTNDQIAAIHLNLFLKYSGVDAAYLQSYIKTSMCEPIRPKTLREAIRYKLQIIQAERLLLFLPAS
jgi:hypothetical protein